jgi:hypothetical protein
MSICAVIVISLQPMGTQFRYSGDLTQGRNGAAEARILSSEGRKSWICLTACQGPMGKERGCGSQNFELRGTHKLDMSHCMSRPNDEAAYCF